jgi:hypothetical protein
MVEAYSERNVHPGTVVSDQTSVTLNSVHVMIFTVCLNVSQLKKIHDTRSQKIVLFTAIKNLRFCPTNTEFEFK